MDGCCSGRTPEMKAFLLAESLTTAPSSLGLLLKGNGMTSVDYINMSQCFRIASILSPTWKTCAVRSASIVEEDTVEQIKATILPGEMRMNYDKEWVTIKGYHALEMETLSTRDLSVIAEI